jgi:hypothetical protein
MPKMWPVGVKTHRTQDGDHLCINMVNSQVNVATRSRDYSSPQTVPGLEYPPPLEMPLQIEKLEPPPRILKGVLKCSTHNPNARATHNYSIVEDLGQTPCAMSALEVLQTCPSQRNALLSALGALDPSGSKVIKFDVTDVKPRLPYHVAFQIHVGYSKYTIKHVVVDEGVATCVMSLICWKSLDSPTLSQYLTMLTSFDSHSFHPHCILPAFPVQLGGKMVEVDVEVVDAPLDYNLLLGHNWTYAMTIVVSSIFHTLCFPHDGKIVTINSYPLRMLAPVHLLDRRSLWSKILSWQLRISMSECIHPLWVPSTSWHWFTMFTPCPVGPFHQRGSFLSTLPILMILGPYLPRLHVL